MLSASVVDFAKKKKKALLAMTEGTVGGGVRKLFAVLPDQSALRRPLSRVLLDDLPLEEIRRLDLSLKEETIKRYRNEPLDLTPLMAKRRAVEHINNVPFQARRTAAATWVESECGVTQSGRAETVFKTECNFNLLFERYARESGNAEHVSVNVFAEVCKEKHVHFNVGAVDTMTCVNCRDWAVKQSDLHLALQVTESAKTRKALQKKYDKITKQLEDHQDALVRQRRAWYSDLDKVKADSKRVLCIVDFSTFELMDRKTTSVFCVVVIDNVGNALRRRYFDFVDVHLSGRKRDVVYYTMTLLYRRGVFSAGQRVCLWSDAGSSDFRNAACLYSCLQLNSVCPQIVFESFNFFGARHGWSDCDRHFGNAKQAVSRWLVKEASRHKELKLDVDKCAEILAALPNTVVLKITKALIHGAEHPSITGLTQHYSFRFVNEKTAGVSMFSDDTSAEKEVSFPKGRMLDAEDAKAIAQRRKAGQK